MVLFVHFHLDATPLKHWSDWTFHGPLNHKFILQLLVQAIGYQKIIGFTYNFVWFGRWQVFKVSMEICKKDERN